MWSDHIFRWRGPNCRPKSGCQSLPFPALVGELWQKRDFEEFLLRAEAAQCDSHGGTRAALRRSLHHQLRRAQAHAVLGPAPRRSALRKNRRFAGPKGRRYSGQMKTDNFFAELKRRNVYKVAVAYAIVGWLLVQVATQVFP